jgi:uncharacterized membrane protein YdbT with pleckstrin-like domain
MARKTSYYGKEVLETMYIPIHSVVALIAGILILIIPRLLSYIVAIYLIIFGILGLMHV